MKNREKEVSTMKLIFWATKFVKVSIFDVMIGSMTFLVLKHFITAVLLMSKRAFIFGAIAGVIFYGISEMIKSIQHDIEDKKRSRVEFEPERIVYCDFDGNVFV